MQPNSTKLAADKLASFFLLSFQLGSHQCSLPNKPQDMAGLADPHSWITPLKKNAPNCHVCQGFKAFFATLQ
jgi:hypothetical protein